MCDNVEPFGLNFANFKVRVAQNHMPKFTELPCILLAWSPLGFMMLLQVACLVASNWESRMVIETYPNFQGWSDLAV